MSHFFQLQPDLVMKCCERAGFEPTGEFLQLNSYENRVFDIRMEDRSQVIAKFYRPGRWSKSAIQDEHNFLRELAAEGIKAVEPLTRSFGSIFDFEGMHVSFFPKIRAKMPDELLPKDLERVGRILAQLHNVGVQAHAPSRLTMNTEFYGWASLSNLQNWIAPEVINRYNQAASTVIEVFEQDVDEGEFIRIHGDAHRGNLLWSGEEFFLVDFDDFCNGPVVQDMWMLLSGDPETFEEEKEALMKGYEEFRHFPDHEWKWIPLLRGLRIINYAGWIASRWSDPSFPKIFPSFKDYTYWANETEALEQIAWAVE